MTVITMTREMGSGGKDVAQGVAQELGLQVLHKEVVEHHLAELLHVRESSVHRYLEGESRLLENWRIDKKALARYTAEEILELAEGGNVLIRGWGATQLLRPVSHVVSIRVCAPLEVRIDTLMLRLNLHDRKAALKEITENDAAHTRVGQCLRQEDWRNPELYDLVLNTERVPLERCVALACALVEDVTFKETPHSRAMLTALKSAARQREHLHKGAAAHGLVASPVRRRSPGAGLAHYVSEDRPTRREDRELL